MRYPAASSLFALVALILMPHGIFAADDGNVFHAMGEMTGEVGRTSAILQSRLTKATRLVDGDVPGSPGIARFEISERREFTSSRKTGWIEARPDDDFIVKAKVVDLKPNTQYFYRLIFGPNENSIQVGDVCSFRTLQGKEGSGEVSFVVVTGMNYMSFHYGTPKQGVRTGNRAYSGADKELGYPAVATMLEQKPDFFVGTGDNVYYDSHDDREATDIRGMRRKWHEQLVQPRFVELFRDLPTYWEKDDHDHRFNDCDRTGNRPPESDLGIRIFREQVPVVDPIDPNAKTYRTFRINRNLQIWLVEGRDYRSPNKMDDGPEKTLWGADQIEWLKRTLLASDAAWKILISPTPMVGPDDAYKIDNHTNHRGFRNEGRAFFSWVKEHRLDENGFYVICGDRHWQYHSIDPTGIEEFSCGALVDANSRLGRSPGDKKSTDPDAEIRQLYTQSEASGGFLKVTVTKDAHARFEFFDENGKSLYQTVKHQTEDLSVLGGKADTLLRDHLLQRVHQQYDSRREAVDRALQSQAALEARQKKLGSSLKRMLGELPEKTPLRANVTGVIQQDGYRIEKVVYQSRPKHYVTANLYIPTTRDGPFPGVLIACGHSSQGKAYEPYQRAAILMALHGMVALVYDPIGQGERLSYLSGSGNPGLQHKLDNVSAVLVGRTAVGYQAWDGVRSLDYLLSREEVDSTKPIGMTGNSGGGAQTMYLMALDDRIGPAAPSCHITTLERNFDIGGAGDGCQSPPLTGAEGVDHPDFFTIRAPRPSIILSAEQDYKDIRFTRKTFDEVKRVYGLLGRADAIGMFAFDDKHAFSQPRREAAASWMRRWLLGDFSPVSEPNEMSTQSAKTLQVTKSGQVLREYSGALAVTDLNRKRAEELTIGRKAFWSSQDRMAAVAEIRDMVGARQRVVAPTVEHRGVINRGEYRIEKLVLRREGEVPLPALLVRPHRLGEQPTAVVYVDGRGKATDVALGGPVEQLLSQGHIVLAIDVRGMGETTDAPSEVKYAAGDHRVAMWSMHIGHSLLGQRVEDVLSSIEYVRSLPAVDAERVQLVGIGKAGPAVLHAAVFDSRCESVTLRDSIGSWMESVIVKPHDLNAISHVVPRALMKYDLPDLAALLEEPLIVE